MDKTEIYYFTGTGNSLAVARDIAEKINGKVMSITSVVNEETIETDADMVGLVFPIYYDPYGGVPLIVRRFISKLQDINSKYIFTVCTYGSGAFSSLKFLEELIESQGGKLSAGFMVNMPNNMGGSTLNNEQKQQKMFHVWKDNMEMIYEHVNAHNEGKFYLPNTTAGKFFILIKLFFTPLMFLFKPLTLRRLRKYSDQKSQSYEELLPFMDNSFYTDKECVGCGNCSRICPVGNIQIINDKPQWQHHCEFCLACFHWCPNGAIKSSELKNTVRYHHPDVTFSDMIN